MKLPVVSFELKATTQAVLGSKSDKEKERNTATVDESGNAK